MPGGRDVPTRCPICGAPLADLAFDAAPGEGPPQQTAESHEIVTYTCGHEVIGGSLTTADQERLDVERRTSEETVEG
ncbi:MAG TPA: hypothetical protein VIB62_11145 [Actinomycetota bacterium]|jgi:hypothetical protein